MRKRRSRFFRSFFVQSWWVWLFALVCYATYDYTTARQERRAQRLEERLREKEAELHSLQTRHDDLIRRLQSQSDPEWVELVLMEQLGVVPEGQTKVYFETPS